MPSSTKRFLTRSTLRALMRRISATASPRARCSLNSPSSQLSRISALITFCD